ncbi:MAG: hypothetical protein JWP29_5334 [Rhodoferax sp.]|nr:hypothetical protein [Rhodoferax sp.]
MMKNRLQLGVMPTILLVIFIATTFVAVNFARKPASDERRAALLEQAQPHPDTAAWAEERLAGAPRLSNGGAVRLQHEIKTRLKDNGMAATQPLPTPMATEAISATPTVSAMTPAAPANTGPGVGATVRDGSRPASEIWRMAFGTLAAATAAASILWAYLKRRL